MGLPAASPNIRTRIRAPRLAGQLGFIAQLPAGVLWTADTGSVNHWIEFDVGLAQQMICPRYADAANLVRLNNSEQTGISTIQGVQRIAGTDNANSPAGTAMGVTTQAGDRWRCEAEGLVHRYKLMRAGVAIYTTANLGQSAITATGIVAKLPGSTVVTNNVTYGVL